MTFHQENFDNGPSPIRKLEQQQENTALQIHAVFQSSYRIEAELLGVDDFPPLRRSAEDIKQSSTSFYGYFENGKLAAVTELELSFGELDICSFVVDPKYFRMGIGSKLLDAVFAEFPNRNRIVETGADNYPAISLYEKKGFRVEKRWMTEIGIEKVRLKMGSN